MPFLKLAGLALDGITSFSIAPLRLASAAGSLIASGALLFAIPLLTRELLYDDPVGGYPTLLLTVAFLGGLQLIAVGLLGEYVGRLLVESKRRPLYLIDVAELPFWGKPPLSFWLTATSFKLLGLNEFAARLPSLLLTFAVMLLVYNFTRKNLTVDTALSASAILLTSAIGFVAAGAVMTDASLLLGITLSMVAFWRAVIQRERRWRYLFFLGIAIGLLAKGTVALLLTAFPVGLWLLCNKSISWSLRCLPRPETITYFPYRPFSAEFYSRGTALEIRSESGLLKFLAAPGNEFLAIHHSKLIALPSGETSCLRLEKQFSRYHLFEKLRSQCQEMPHSQQKSRTRSTSPPLPTSFAPTTV